MAIFCMYCGRKHENTANFCGGCGESLRTSPNSLPKNLINKISSFDPSSRSSENKKSIGFWIISIILWFFLSWLPVFIFSVLSGGTQIWGRLSYEIEESLLLSVIFIIGIPIYIYVYKRYAKLYNTNLIIIIFICINFCIAIVGVLLSGFQLGKEFLGLFITSNSSEILEYYGYDSSNLNLIGIYAIIHLTLFFIYFVSVLRISWVNRPKRFSSERKL